MENVYRGWRLHRALSLPPIASVFLGLIVKTFVLPTKKLQRATETHYPRVRVKETAGAQCRGTCSKSKNLSFEIAYFISWN